MLWAFVPVRGGGVGSTLNDRVWNRYFICAALMVLTFIFLFIVLSQTRAVN